MRPDRALRAVQTGIDRTHALKALKSGAIWVNGKEASLKTVLTTGDAVKAKVQPRAEKPKTKAPVAAPSPEKETAQGFGLLHLDADIAVVNNPAGMATHPAGGLISDDTLVTRVAAYLAAQG